MTRNEEILKAARAYVSGVSLSSPSNFIHFAAGARWADEHPNLKSLWHDASEKPRPKEWILVNFGEDDYKTLSLNNLFIDRYWCDWCKIFNIICWAYVSDLLPKQFGNSEQLKGGEK